MEINNSTLSSNVSMLKSALAGCDFVAVDCEMTGIGTMKSEYLDTLQERYSKYKTSAQEFQLVQYGICTFEWNQSTAAYDAKPFNAYLFPKASSGNDTIFKCQSSSLEFLKKHKFDFNRWISDGIPYLSAAQEQEALSRIQTPKHEIPIDDKNTDFITNSLEKINQWLQSDPSQKFKMAGLNSYQRRLLYQEVPKKFNGYVSVDGGDMGGLTFKKLTVEEKDDLLSREDVQKKEIREMVGFRDIIDALIEAKKPVVGHNMLLDICHTINSFCHVLPDDVNDFKTSTLINFPRLYDTKLMAQFFPPLAKIFPQSTIAEIVAVSESTLEFPKVDIHHDFESFLNHGDLNLHNAGYDAYATGLIFARMCGHLCSLEKDLQLDLSNENLVAVQNKLNLMRSDIPYFHMDGYEESPKRNHVFRIFDFPKEWKTSNIQDAFKNISNVNVNWLNDSSAWIVLRDVLKADLVHSWCESKKKKKRPFSLESFETYTIRSKNENNNDLVTDKSGNNLKRKIDNTCPQNTKKIKTEITSELQKKDCIIQ